jgi:DNA primase
MTLELLRPRTELEMRTLQTVLGFGLTDEGRAYLAHRRLDGVATSLGFGVVPDSAPGFSRFAGRLSIPYLNAAGQVVDATFRCIARHLCDEADCRRYDRLPGYPKRIYNIRAVHAPGGEIHIAEGELDAAALTACGLQAVGVSGANSWKSWHRRIFAGHTRVVVWPDGDAAGRDGARRVADSIRGAIIVDGMGPGEDVNDVFRLYGRERIEALAKGIPHVTPEPDGEAPPF